MVEVESDIITLCGSVRLGKKIWDKVAQELALKGNLIFTVNVWGLYDYLHSPEGEFQKRILDTTHKLKIEKSNRVVVLTKDGYIGESTRSEIAHAIKEGVKVEYFDVTHLEDYGKCQYCGSLNGYWSSIYDWHCRDCGKVTVD